MAYDNRSWDCRWHNKFLCHIFYQLVKRGIIMKAKIIEINGRLYMTVGGVIQYECDEKGNRKE